MTDIIISIFAIGLILYGIYTLISFKKFEKQVDEELKKIRNKNK